MTTFDFNQVREFAAEVNAQLDQCENGEGMHCHTIDSTLSFCAERCCQFADKLRNWGRDVFTGRVAFDPAAEQLWKAELSRLCSRAITLLSVGRQAEISCFVLDGKRKLEAALWNLSQIMNGWVTPKLAAGPSARQELFLDSSSTEDVRKRIELLPSLAADWRPDDQRQAVQLQRIRSE